MAVAVAMCDVVLSVEVEDAEAEAEGAEIEAEGAEVEAEGAEADEAEVMRCGVNVHCAKRSASNCCLVVWRAELVRRHCSIHCSYLRSNPPLTNAVAEVEAEAEVEAGGAGAGAGREWE